MKFKVITPLMETKDLQETISFYKEILGFTLAGTFDHDGKTIWCRLYRDKVDIMFSLPNIEMNYGRILLSGSLYIYIDSVDEFWETIKDKVEVVYPPENFEYGMREFAIKDNNGYVLNFGESTE
jgi:uncharacterized glyoxalase superfamily protein PhnB